MEKTIFISRQIEGKVKINDTIIEKVTDVIFDDLDIDEVDGDNGYHAAGNLLDYTEEEIAKVMLAIADELKERYSK